VKEIAKHLPQSLQRLDLCDNSIGAEGVKELAKHLPQSLKTLDLGYNNIGESQKIIRKLAKEKNISLFI
jgi:Leucine-rich repeat (LRR) protein